MRRVRRHIPRPGAAFTLIELIAVMLLLGIIAAIVAPSLSAFAAGRRLNDTSLTMLSLIQIGRANAASEGRPYRFNMDVEKRQYWLTAQEGGAFTELGTSLGQKIDIPDDITATWEAPEGQSTIGYVTITPLGEVDPSQIKLVGREEHELYLVSNALTDKYRIAGKDDLETTATYVDATLTNTNKASKSTGSSRGSSSSSRSSGRF